MPQNLPIILASQSPARIKLLKQIHLTPSQIIPAHIDETELPKELPKNLATRLSQEKGMVVAQQIDNGYIISADTVATCSRIILPKAESPVDVEYCLKLLSGKRHRLYTGVTITKNIENNIVAQVTKLVTTIIKFKPLTEQEIKYYSNCDEGIGKAGGYSVQGYAASFVTMFQGSFSNIVGLPLTETRNMLMSLGFTYPQD